MCDDSRQRNWPEYRQAVDELRRHIGSRDVPCPGCGYSLAGLESRRCPECGLELDVGSLKRDPEPPERWSDPDGAELSPRALALIAVVGLAVAAVLFIGVVLLH